jgi:hypothetical protein
LSWKSCPEDGETFHRHSYFTGFKKNPPTSILSSWKIYGPHFAHQFIWGIGYGMLVLGSAILTLLMLPIAAHLADLSLA